MFRDGAAAAVEASDSAIMMVAIGFVGEQIKFQMGFGQKGRLFGERQMSVGVICESSGLTSATGSH
jgi:flagellar biosynthesis protein FliR